MKHFYLLTIALLLGFSAKSQILTPVKWSYAAKRTSKTTGILFIKASIDNGWHIYSQNLPKGGPIKTTIKFTPSATYRLIGNTSEPKPITKYEDTFHMNVGYFEKVVVFQQKITLKAGKHIIKGSVSFMSCNEKQCLPEDTMSFSIPI
jgi:DsbC/DsbD-like thiol-disulfide interchange protein